MSVHPESIAASSNALASLLVAYDRLRRAAGGVPRREDVGLAELKPLLGWEFFAEWVAPASIVVRLSGAHIDYLLGTNVTRENFFDKYRPEDQPRYSRFYGAIADHPCGGYTVRRVIVGGAEALHYHSIYLPLAAKPSHVPIVGAVALSGFERIADAATAGAPDFRALSRMGLFDIGFGLPAADGLERIDIAAVIKAIDAGGGTGLDPSARQARPLIGRPPNLG